MGGKIKIKNKTPAWKLLVDILGSTVEILYTVLFRNKKM